MKSETIYNDILKTQKKIIKEMEDEKRGIDQQIVDLELKVVEQREQNEHKDIQRKKDLIDKQEEVDKFSAELKVVYKNKTLHGKTIANFETQISNKRAELGKL